MGHRCKHNEVPLHNQVCHCYVDESGDEGFKFDHGSSPWFFLAAVIVRDEEEPLVRRALDEIEERLWRSKGQMPPKVLHWKTLRYEQKVVVCQQLRDKPFCLIAAGMNKRRIWSNTAITDSGYLYRYAARLLLERVTWYVEAAMGWATLTFSNRARFRKQLLCSYLAQVLADPRTRMKPVFKPDEIEVAFPADVKMLQITDACTSAIAAAFNPDYYGNTHLCYCEAIKRRLYRHEGRLLSYGLKLFPDSQLMQDYPFLGGFS